MGPMGQPLAAEHLDQSQVPVLEGPAPGQASPIAESARQILDSADVQQIAKFLNGYTGDVGEYIKYLQSRYGNVFVNEVVAEQQKTKEPSVWDKLRTDGKVRLFESKKAADPVKEEEPAADANSASGITTNGALTIDDSKKEIGSTSGSKAAKYIDRDKKVEMSHGSAAINSKVADTSVTGTGTAKASAQEVEVAGSSDIKANLVGTTVAIHSKPFTHELFGESVTAQFHLGVSAQTYAEAKGNLGVNVGWQGFGAKAELTGAGNGNVDLTGAATLSWAKQSPSTYAAKLMANGSYKALLGRYLPAWAVRAMPESRVQGWLTSLIELVITQGSGDQLVLGASTSANARGALGLPRVSFAGGAMAVKSGAGLSFGGAETSFDVEMGRDAGMELLTMLAFGGGTALFQKLAPNTTINKFLEQKLDASLDKAQDGEHEGGEHAGEHGKEGFAAKMAKLRDTAKGLDGTHTKAWTKGQQHDVNSIKDEGHDVTYTRDKTGSATRTGQDARDHHAAQTEKMDQAATVSKKQPGKLQQIADKALDTEISIAKTQHHYSKTAIDKTTKNFEVAGAQGELSGRALELESSATGEATASRKGLAVSGNAGASAYLMGGQVHISTPNLPFTILGEQLVGKVDVSADAGAFAQVQGNVGLDVGFSGAGMSANLSGFAGVKAGITAAGSLMWSRKPTAYYVEQIVQTGAWKTMFGQWMPQWVLNRAPDKYVRQWIGQLIELLVNGNGDSLVLGAIARGEGSAGIGAAASFSAKFQGGVLHCHGRGGITFGLGAGAAVDMSLGLTDGMAMLGVMALRGGTQMFNMLQPSMSMMSYLKPLFSQMRNRELPEPKKNQSASPATG